MIGVLVIVAIVRPFQRGGVRFDKFFTADKPSDFLMAGDQTSFMTTNVSLTGLLKFIPFSTVSENPGHPR
jgi:hypothetical protein